MTIYKSVLELIGNTPMVQLNNINKNIYLKLERNNPGGSVKDRAVLGMILDFEQRGMLNQNSTLIEATSGNTGIAIAMIAKLKGYRAIIIMPESMSKERRALIRAYGAKLILTPAEKGMQGAIDEMDRLLKENKDYVSLKQFDNQANPNYHYLTTGKEIYDDLKDADIFLAGVGTGGTLIGIGKYLKEKNPNLLVVAVEPEESQVLAGKNAGTHKIQGIGANFIPNNYDKNIVDRILPIKGDESYDAVRLLGEKEGLLVGISAGANVAAAIKLSKEYPNKKIVTIAPDGVEKYISMDIF